MKKHGERWPSDENVHATRSLALYSVPTRGSVHTNLVPADPAFVCTLLSANNLSDSASDIVQARMRDQCARVCKFARDHDRHARGRMHAMRLCSHSNDVHTVVRIHARENAHSKPLLVYAQIRLV
jgi:hypothetical protein